jgi:hypothetical protein
MGNQEVTMDVKTAVKEKYGAAARVAPLEGVLRAALGESGCGCDPITTTSTARTRVGKSRSGHEGVARLRQSPALAALGEGEVVSDLGSGGGIDGPLGAQGRSHRAGLWRLDPTDRDAGAGRGEQTPERPDHVQFLRGDIEQIPLPDAISGCS